jgi:hypothetical protein
LEHPHRSALENHVHRTPRLGNHGLLNVRIGITHVVGAVLGFMRLREFQPLLGGEATCGPPARRTKVIGSLSSGVFADTFSG